MGSITYIIALSNAKSRISAFRQGQAIQPTTVQAGGAVSPGKIQMRSVVDGIELGCAFNLPAFPSFSVLGKGEAGSCRLPALKLGKLNSSYTPG